MDNLYSKLHNLYSVQKTLRFELKPIGKTRENIENAGLLQEDQHRADIYKSVKKYCDEYHKKFIEESLENLQLNNLEEYYELYKIENKDDKQKDRFKKVQELLRKEIASSFKVDSEKYKGLFGKEMIQTYLYEMYKDDNEKIKDISEFNKFTTYFTGYNQNRENMYTDEDKSTSIAYRIINENLPTFIYNMKIYNSISDRIPEAINNIYHDLESYIQTLSLDDMFKLDYYNDVLTQRGIEIYNIVISGKSEENGNKIKGLNEYINEYNQRNKDKTKIPKLKELYKQILSDKVGTSFVIDMIENDQEAVDLIKEFYANINQNIIINNSIVELYKNIEEYDLEKIYINNDLSLTNISNKVFGDWNYIQTAIENDYDKCYKGKVKIGTDKYYEQRKKDLDRITVFSIKYIDTAIGNLNCEDKGKIIVFFKEYLKNNAVIENIKAKFEACSDILNKEYSKNSRELIKDNEGIEKIKDLLDSIKILQEFVKILIPKDKTIDVEEIFYSNLYEENEILQEIIPLYNKERNYLTQKLYSKDKIKLNFETPTFLDGWDVSKEQANLGVLFTKDNNYYLGIMNSDSRKIFSVDEESNSQNVYKKIEYRLLPGPNKMLPKVFFSKSRIDEFEPSAELVENYKKGKFKKGENFDLQFCHELIDFYKESIKKNKDWKDLHFNFKDTNEYEDISQFYKDVENQGYKISFRNFSEEYINKLVDEGKLYLFQIYNKDFSKYSKGNKNLHTIYWNEVFDEENLKDVVYKLNGNAEVFFRKASLKLEETAIHPANNPIDNKNEDTIKHKPKSLFDYDLIKNKRFTEDKFEFHVPITMNFKSQGVNNINEIVNKYLKYNDDVHVIGIDRGERNLIYISVIDYKGHIVYQESLNEIINEYNQTSYKTDYHELLNKKEKERDEARKSWKAIDNIKELKEGYMSQVVHRIVELMIKYNAIIVIEDLNKGFKNSRIKVEKQVYQKFEHMLIDKLNYLVIKGNEKKSEGGALNAYQLTNKFDSFQKLGRQTGVLFYIPAWCTSKIDPTTGFVNLFYIKNESLEKSKDFIRKINDIRYNENESYFEFDIDYSKFTNRLNDSRKDWTICTNSNRIRNFRDANNNNMWSSEYVELTKEFKNLFNHYNIDIKNIKDEILNKSDSKFFNANKEKDGFYGFTTLFKLTVQMRNSVIGSMEDYIISPVKNKYGMFFDSRNGREDLPKDADANGAYNIARKGLMLIRQIQNTEDNKLGKVKYDITNKEWLNFAQDEDNM